MLNLPRSSQTFVLSTRPSWSTHGYGRGLPNAVEFNVEVAHVLTAP